VNKILKETVDMNLITEKTEAVRFNGASGNGI